MLARYNRLVFESNMSKGAATLRKWAIQKAEFQTTAAETMHGLKGNADNQQPV